MQLLGAITLFFGITGLLAWCMIGLRAYARFVSRLKLNHPEHWKSLGSPRRIEDEPQYGSYSYKKYFWGRIYADLGDSELTALGDRTVRAQAWMLVCVLLGAAGVTMATWHQH